MSDDNTLFQSGDRVSGAGVIVLAPEGSVHFCPAGPAVHEGVPDHAISLHGGLTDRLVTELLDDSIGGGPWSAIDGIWVDGAVELTWFHWLDESPVQSEPPLRSVPCDPPAGGWLDNAFLPREISEAEKSLWEQKVLLGKHRVDLDDTTQIFLFVAADAAYATEILAPIYGNSACIVQSLWPSEQLESTMHDIISPSPWRTHVYGMGQTIGPNGQLHLTVSLVHPTPAFNDWLQSQPDGLVAPSFALTKSR